MKPFRLQHLLDDLAGLHDQVLGRLELNRSQSSSMNGWPDFSPHGRRRPVRKGLDLGRRMYRPIFRPSSIDPDRMAQAMGNIFSNAIKFTPAGGKVSTA